MDIATEISARLNGAVAPTSPNRITAEQLRAWALEYLEFYDDELSRFPDLADEPHWDLWMMDARFEDACFAVLIFHLDSIEFFCGTGNAFEIKRFAESDFRGGVEELQSQMARRFLISEGSVAFKRAEGQGWLGRGW